MKLLHSALVVVIIVLLAVIGIQWRGSSSETPVPPSPPSIQKVTISPTTEKTEPEKSTPSEPEAPAVPEKTTETLPQEPSTEIDTSELVTYTNTSYHYSLSLPKDVYYAGFGKRDTALHTLAIQSDSLPEDFARADIRVYYYGKNIPAELTNAHNNMYQDPAGTYALLLLDGTHAVRIESANMSDPTVQTIIQTISISE